MIRQLSHELGMQFIMSTHSEDLIESADSSFQVLQDDNEISHVTTGKTKG